MFTLFYTEGCTDKLRVFENIEELYMFVGAFTVKNLGNEDSWINAVIDGGVLHSDVPSVKQTWSSSEDRFIEVEVP